MKFSFLSDFNRIFSLFDNKFKIKYLILILLSIIASVFEFFSISLLIPLVSSFTGENDLLNNYLNKLGLENKFNDLIGIETIILIFMTVYLLKFVFLIFLVYFKNYFIFSLQKELFLKLYRSYIYRDYYFHLYNNSAKLIRNLIQNIQQLTVGYLSSFSNIVLETLVVFSLIILIALFQTNTSLIIIFSLGLIIFIVLNYLKKIAKKLGENRQVFFLSHLKSIMQSLEGIKEIKIFLKENKTLSIARKNLTALTKNNYFIQFLNETPRLVFELLAIMASLLMLKIFINIGYSLETIVTYFVIIIAVIIRILPSTNKIMTSFINLSVNKPALEIVCDELEKNQSYILKKKEDKNLKEIIFEKNIDLKNLTFAYKKNEKENIFLNEINLRINRGEMIGLVGKTGSGKSTLIDLIIGLLEPQNGNVEVDGVDIKNNYDSWKKKIGYVPQNVFLYDSDILNNILFDEDSSNVDQERLDQSIINSQLKNFIDDSADGINTKVGERGSNLSGGQRQRIGIARAIYQNSDFLIFDESTSALDETTQKEFIDSLNKLKKKKTILIASHDKNTLIYCDKIFELNNGTLKQIN